MQQTQTSQRKFVFDESNTFYISLQNDNCRRIKMEDRFKQFNLKYTRWIASTPLTLEDNFVSNLSELQKACTQSHINIWKHIIENKLSYTLILEDDAMFDKDWLNKLEKFNISDPLLDMILLNASEPESVTDLWVIAKEQYLTGGYILTYNGALHLIELFKTCYPMSDWMTSRLQLLGHSYVYYPWLIIQEGNYSTIGSNVDADHEKVTRCLNSINYDIKNYL